MAIVQISRITQRKGLEQDLPEPLAGAELGWAIDQRRLFIGNGELSEGAPVVGNTEILTEFSDILALSAAYTYQGAAAGYIVQTGATAGTPVTQSLQSWLDNYAVVTDFGATGDGMTDDTAAINRALFQLFCRQVNPQIRRSLFFPAGTYKITNTILIPPYCTLYGEGTDSSIISLEIDAWSTLLSYAQGVIVENTGSYYESLIPVPAGIAISNATYWSAVTQPGYIARTADSLQQTGVNIGTNGATSPTSITIQGLAFATNQEIDGVLVEKCTKTNFSDVTISGPLATGDLATPAANIAGVRWSSSASLVCTNVTFDRVAISGYTFGTATDQQIKGCVFNQCSFDTLYIGVQLGAAVVVDGGPTGTRILGSVFDNIYAQGVKFQSVGLNATAYNIFYDVGNHFNGAALPATSVIDIDADENVSVGDMFERTAAQSTTFPRINLNDTVSIGVSSADKIELGTYTRFSGTQAILPDNTSTTTLFTVDATQTRAFRVDYTITRDSPVSGLSNRTGTYTVVASTDGNGLDLASDDTFIENENTGVTLSTSESASVISFEYATSSIGSDAVFTYSITKLA